MVMERGSLPLSVLSRLKPDARFARLLRGCTVPGETIGPLHALIGLPGLMLQASAEKVPAVITASIAGCLRVSRKAVLLVDTLGTTA